MMCLHRTQRTCTGVAHVFIIRLIRLAETTVKRFVFLSKGRRTPCIGPSSLLVALNILTMLNALKILTNSKTRCTSVVWKHRIVVMVSAPSLLKSIQVGLIRMAKCVGWTVRPFGSLPRNPLFYVFYEKNRKKFRTFTPFHFRFYIYVRISITIERMM